MKTRTLTIALLMGTACAALPLHASNLDPLAITIVEASGETYFEPAGRRIVIRTQPVQLFIRIRNASEAAILARVHPGKAYALELKDAAGVTSMVKRKVGPGGQSDDDIRVNLPAGADRIIPMHITREAWEGIPDVKAGKETTFTARVVYETIDGQHVYSEPYTLIFRIEQ